MGCFFPPQVYIAPDHFLTAAAVYFSGQFERASSDMWNFNYLFSLSPLFSVLDGFSLPF